MATPGWPEGMKSQATVSWIVSVPPRMEAHLMFANVSQPKCSFRHTKIRVLRVGRREEDYSQREDQEAKKEITVSERFYLNMSNCMPERGHFSVITKITLRESKSKRRCWRVIYYTSAFFFLYLDSNLLEMFLWCFSLELCVLARNEYRSDKGAFKNNNKLYI